MTHQLTLNFSEKQMDMLWHTRMQSFWPEQKDRFEYVDAKAHDPANEVANAMWFMTDEVNHGHLNMFWLDTNADTFLFCAMLEQLNCSWAQFNDLKDNHGYGGHCVLSDYQPVGGRIVLWD